MKRTLSLVLALVMVLGTFGTVFAEEAEVVNVTEEAGALLEEIGVLVGDQDGNLMLDEGLKREHAVVLLARLMGEFEVAKEFPTSEESPTYKDIKEETYEINAPFLAWAQANETFVGHSPEKFGYGELLTAREYAVVLLKVLGHDDVEWTNVLEKAAELELLEEEPEVFTRGTMAVMTEKALYTKVKDSDLTLAEKLELEMPAPAVPAVLEVEDVVADNLKEVKVMFNKDVDEDLTNIDFYETDAGTIDHAFVEDGNIVVLSLKDKMKEKTYSLTIKGTKEVDGEYDFTVKDNAIPYVKEVVGLGTKAVKVVMSEPIKEAKISEFKIDGKTIYGKLDVTGREAVIRTYTALSIGEHELTVNSLEDFAGFKSLVTTMDFEVVEDKDAPTVVDAVAPALEKVIVTFSEEVDPNTVNKKTVYHGNKVYATSDPKALTPSKYEFTFAGEDGLPLHETTLYISGVKDYSGNKMDADEVAVKATVDMTRPEVEEVKIDSERKVITVKFTKLVNVEEAKVTVLDEDDDKLYVVKTDPKIEKDPKASKTLEITLGKALSVDDDYTLKLEKIKDTNKYPNYMADYSQKLSVSDVGRPTLTLINMEMVKHDKDEETKEWKFTLKFDKVMDFATLSNPENYLVKVNNVIKPLKELDNEIDIKDSDGRKVEVTVVVDEDDNVEGIAGLELKATNEKTIKNYGEMQEREDEETILFVKAEATDRETIKVTFNQDIVNAPKDAFSYNGNEATKSVISGETVTLTFKEKTIDVDADKKLTIDAKKVEGRFDAIYAGGEEDVDDKIAPSIKEVEVTDEVYDEDKVKLDVTFDEAITFTVDNEDVIKKDLEVTRQTDTKVFKDTDYDIYYNLEDGKITDGKITITISVAKAEIDSAYRVKVLGKGIITDASVAKNIAKVSYKDSKETTLIGKLTVEAVEAAEESKDQDDVDTAQALVTALPAGTVKTALQARINAIKVETPEE